jgi:hypothetical protein
MNIPGNNVPIIGSKEPVMLNAQIVITPQLQRKLAEWQAETGVSMITFGNVVLTLGIAQLSKLLDNDKQALNEEVKRIETKSEDWPPKDS